MTNKRNQCYANDREIYDLLMSSKLRITAEVLHEIAHERGIYFSPRDSREYLAEKIAMLPHSSKDILDMLDRREHSKRAEKTTAIVLKTDCGISDIVTILNQYKEENSSAEKVNFQKQGTDRINVNVQYDEIDYSRTRLIQRQIKEADIAIVKEGDVVTVRIPATEKSRQILESFKNKIEQQTRSRIEQEEIELSHFFNPRDRSRFFTRLMSEIPGYALLTVTRLKVSSISGDSKKNELSVEVDKNTDTDAPNSFLEVDEEEVAEFLLAKVQSASLSGENLVATPEYQELEKRGFFITGIKWCAKQEAVPYHKVLFDVDFEDAQSCKGFKYLVRYSPLLGKGSYARDFRRMKEGESAELYKVIESTARAILKSLAIENKNNYEGEE